MAPTRSLLAAAALMMLSLAGCASDGGMAGAGGDAPASYPQGPYGLGEGDVLPNMTLRTAAGEPVAMEALYEGPAPAALLYVTAMWCFTCGPEIAWLNDYPPRVDGDLEAMIVLLQNIDFEDATPGDAEAFSDSYGAEFVTLLDPDGALDTVRDEAFIPLNILVDTRTMRITLRETGFDPTSLEQAVGEVLENP